MATRKKPVHYRVVFLANSQPQPWPCHFCGEDVVVEDNFHVHHLDNDHANNDPSNLVATHGSCHVSWHGRNSSPETNRKKGRKGQPKSEAHRTAISLGQMGKNVSPETRDKISQSVAEAYRDNPELREKIAKGQRGLKHSPERRAQELVVLTRKYQCTECSLVSTSSGVFRHQKTQGHTGRKELHAAATASTHP